MESKQKKKWIAIFLIVFICLGLICLKNSCQGDNVGNINLPLNEGYKYKWFTDEKDLGRFDVCVPSTTHTNVLRCERDTISEYYGFEAYELFYFIDHKYFMAGIIFEPKAYYQNMADIRIMLENKLDPVQYKSERFWGWRKGGTIIEWYFLENLLHIGHEQTVIDANKKSKE